METLRRPVALKVGCIRQSTKVQKANILGTINKQINIASGYFYLILSNFLVPQMFYNIYYYSSKGM